MVNLACDIPNKYIVFLKPILIWRFTHMTNKQKAADMAKTMGLEENQETASTWTWTSTNREVVLFPTKVMYQGVEVEAYIPSVFQELTNGKLKKPRNHIAFSVVGFDNIIFNVKVDDYSLNWFNQEEDSLVSLGEVYVKITPKVIGNEIVTLDTFEKALITLQDEAGKFKPSATVIELQEDRLIYKTDKVSRVERPFGVFIEWSTEGGINLDKIIMQVSGVYRLLRNKFIVDQNLIINNILQFIKESSNLVLQG